jgi:DNA repair exonuclease SbcCD ATPase subunit
MEKIDLENSEKRTEKQHTGTKTAARVLDELDKEIEKLGEEKTNLLEIERKLADEIEEEVKRRKEKRNLLKTEVSSLKKKCEELTCYVNTFRREQPVEA